MRRTRAQDEARMDHGTPRVTPRPALSLRFLCARGERVPGRAGEGPTIQRSQITLNLRPTKHRLGKAEPHSILTALLGHFGGTQTPADSMPATRELLTSRSVAPPAH
jgi:hypothetical protein